MTISIDYATKVITVPQADLTFISAGLYELDVEDFRLWLKDWEDDPSGMAMPDTHRRNAPVTLAGTTYAQTFEIINGYTVTFENGTYTVRIVGGNHNIGDVKNVNSVSLIIGNSGGLIVTSSGGGGGTAPTAGENAAAVWQYIIESGMGADEILRVMAAVLAGKVSGAGSGVETFKGLDGTTDRVVSTVDSNGNRTNVTVNGA